MAITHPFPPVFDKNSRILILGSFPSVKSREQQFFYGHPQNRFWQVTARIFECDVPQTIEQKTKFLLKNNIAVWDVIQSCDIVGSSDSSIKNVVPNDLTPILSGADIKHIYANGQTSYKLFVKYQQPVLHREITVLPSTSPANAAYSIERLIKSWEIIKND